MAGATPGPKPLPSHVKVQRGNPGKRSDPGQTEDAIQAPQRKLRAPKGLNKRQQKHWRDLAHQFHQLQLTTDLDIGAMRLLVDAWERYLQANEAVNQYGLVVQGHNGVPMQSPYLQVANKAHADVLSMLREFGMTPSSRSRVTQAAQALEPEDDGGGMQGDLLD